ncbi:hypothetical protein EC991_009638 [Linnemannia zychae]|nr:hypothetical protein EC991_009638 [Linnemannia zychae]
MNDDWKYHIPPKRRGAYYFLNNPSRTWTASDYFDARSPSLLNKASLTGELAGWVSLFRSGGCQALSDMATSLERTDTRKYWEGKEKGSYEQEMASTVRKRSLAIRKENLKQHDIDSVAMTHELDLLHRSRSPYVEAKRRRYNTRAAASLAAPTPSSLLSAAAFKNVAQDVDEPLSPFVTHRSDTGRLNSTATSSTCAADADPGEVMDQNDQASITSTPSTSPSSYKPSEFMDGYDAAAVLWALRENIAEKVSIAVDIESGKQIAELKRPHEFLDSTLEPSTRRRGVDRDSGGVRPDFQSYFRSGNNKFHLLTIEIKKKQQTTSPMLSDLEKVALQLKTVWTVLPKIASTLIECGFTVLL